MMTIVMIIDSKWHVDKTRRDNCSDLGSHFSPFFIYYIIFSVVSNNVCWVRDSISLRSRRRGRRRRRGLGC